MICAPLKAKRSERKCKSCPKVNDEKSSDTQKRMEVFDEMDVQKNQTRSDNYLAYMSNKKDHKWLSWLTMLPLLMTLAGINAGPLQQVEEKPLLTSRYCNRKNFYSLKSPCQTDEILHNMIIDDCHFRELCSTDEIPVCINAENMGVYVCLKKGLTCPKGRILNAWQDDQFPDRVYLEEVDCPNDSYQPTESDCIRACLLEHRNMSDISDRYILSSRGNNINPTMVYCNFEKGFYNPDGELDLNYDRDEAMKIDFCLNIVDEDPCKDGKYPLPDGLCVNECGHGFGRKPPDFLCRPLEISSSSSVVQTKISTTQTLPVSSTVSSTISRSPKSTKNVTVETVTQSTPAHNENKETANNGIPWWEILCIILGIILALCIVALFLFRRRLCNMYNRRIKNSNCNTYNIKHADIVYFHGEKVEPLMQQPENIVNQV